MYWILPCLLFIGSLAGAAIGMAAGQDLSTGAQIVRHGTRSGAMPCTICHGSRLRGRAAMGAPSLAGAPRAQTLSALAAIAAGTIGTNETMRHEARVLTMQQRKVVADYLRSLTKQRYPPRRKSVLCKRHWSRSRPARLPRRSILTR